MKPFLNLLWIATLSLSSLFLPALGHADKCFKHNILLQLADANGIPVPNTEFWVALDIIKEGQKVTIQLPTINFVSGPYAYASFEYPPSDLFLNGGYIVTSDGYLPPELRPTDIVYRSWLVSSNNGLSLPFSFTQSPDTLPVPPPGYILSITNAGALVIQGAGSSGNLIPVGPQILLPTDISYLVEPKIKLKNNTLLSTTGATNTTEFTNRDAANDSLRDTHINDAFDGVAAWAWSDNSTVSDKTNGTVNLMVAVGKVNKKGKLKVSQPIQLTDLPSEIMVWDTAVAINRTNKDNIVVSYGILDHTISPTRGKIYRAVSFDGGKTWPENGPTNIQPSGKYHSFGDNRGVAADIYGNIWYFSTNSNDNAGNNIDQPFFAVSTDGGVTFEVVYTFPAPPAGTSYDFPQCCFGGDGNGNYGINVVCDYFDINFDILPAVGFIPIEGLGQIGTPSFAILSELINVNILAGITASLDGRNWTFGIATNPGSECDAAFGMVFKSPGALDVNYAGPWNYAVVNTVNIYVESLPLPFVELSEPVRGYIHQSPQSNVFDDKRQALYGLIAGRIPDFSQNMRLYFAISRDNGQTWSNPIDIANTDFANRGFQSMALDSVTGDLYFGWYDGRNDSSFRSVEYYGAVIPAQQLDNLVNCIPLSNPLFSLPSAATPLGSSLQADSPLKKNHKVKRGKRKNIEI